MVQYLHFRILEFPLIVLEFLIIYLEYSIYLFNNLRYLSSFVGQQFETTTAGTQGQEKKGRKLLPYNT